MKYPHLCLSLAILILISCKGKESYNTFFVDFGSSKHLAVSSPVICSGLNIGRVISMTTSGNGHMIVEVEVDTTVHATDHYQFAMVRLDSFGKWAIELIPGVEGRLLTALDTVAGTLLNKKPLQQLDSLEYQIAKDSVLKVKGSR